MPNELDCSQAMADSKCDGPIAPVTRGEDGWQMGKSLLDCNKYMYISKTAADVCFSVGLAGDTPQCIWAHSYVLRSRSPVFEVMLDPAWQIIGKGGKKVATTGPVIIPDISVDAFHEILRLAPFALYIEGVCVCGIAWRGVAECITM